MQKTKTFPAKLLLLSLFMAVVHSFIAVHNRYVPVKTGYSIYNCSMVTVQAHPAVKNMQKAAEMGISKAAARTVAPEVKNIPFPVLPPRIKYSVLPEYPSDAIKNGIEGRVVLSVYVGPSGLPEKIEKRSSSLAEELDQSAINAVSKWRFEPAQRGLQMVGSWFEVPISFKIK